MTNYDVVVTRYGGFRHLSPKQSDGNRRHFTLCSGTSAWTIDSWRKTPDHPLNLTADEMELLPICPRCEKKKKKKK